MKQLSGLDAAFLYLETPTTFGHVTGLMIFERPNPDYDPYAAVHAKFASLVGELEPLRRRLVEVPFGLDHPYWVFDPNFDLDYHIRELRLARPGLVDQLAEQVCRIVGRPMDRTRPLWEVYVIDGLQDGRWALLTKYHHATIDGASGQLMLQIVTDTQPDAPPPGEGPSWEPEALPSTAELLRRTAAQLARNPFRALRVQTRIVGQLADAAGIHSVSSAAGRAGDAVKWVAQLGLRNSGNRPSISLPAVTAPPTPWNKTITGHRRFAMRTTSLDNVKRLKDATGSTVNDIVMAICAGGLREYLLSHDALPDRPLRAMVPVSIRTGDEADPWTNRVSAIVAELPTDCADPVERVARCRKAMQDAKRTHELVPAAELVDLSRYSPPVLSTAAVRLASRLRLADRVSQPFNVVISNVPGPRQPLYFAGSKLCHQFPVSIVTDGQGLNITVVSYLDRLDFGFIADRELVPDVWDLADMHVAEISRLFEATGAQWAQPPQPPSPRRGPVKRAPKPAKPATKKTAKTATKPASTTGRR
ncbi:WS/DGAT/MGAT family O-acyltransferase [Mycobacterium kansasii]|uniref:Diacylglycerol O-acyltransferase n=3 Tax=Mycobacterium kansasii TaxID=1768 RepID=A0A653EXZ5_MYCKA|nr:MULTISPECIES: wax ester/triacylglycerol synthase family O-acyltransferase [Mycobacterium]AGZ53527.1 acyltransferase [Mycobacterium kansasii ATCC 12478]ARG54876.1 wax ester/triacylglycerol synthase family O-acyltransferase [Mycobacterium kansasii]ARG60334.1 wax ester/triacylglycerol synthase family O-acyltransferase [Mycobacterium kansasii]ARG68009.1 wax ester/triacylglycerol synthase family O-acyltransferase [Mycobacterium kansasii]ARG77346.1 wax ester/triacylglycerol synthase family O-acyl